MIISQFLRCTQTLKTNGKFSSENRFIAAKAHQSSSNLLICSGGFGFCKPNQNCFCFFAKTQPHVAEGQISVPTHGPAAKQDLFQPKSPFSTKIAPDSSKSKLDQNAHLTLDIQGHLLRFGTWTPKNIPPKHRSPEEG